MNRRIQNNNTSGYKGVYAHGERWKATIQINGKSKHLAVFKTKEEAAPCYNKNATLLFGKYATLNNVTGIIA